MAHAPLLPLSFTFALPFLGGCAFISGSDLKHRFDMDGDGVSRPEDCDDEDPSVGVLTWYADADADGYGGLVEVTACEGGDSLTSTSEDCNDNSAAVHPDAVEVWYDNIDSDCDGWSDFDADRDGHDSVEHDGEDCDDADADVYPEVTEIWYDGIDGDCDGWSDFDADQDGHDASAQGGSDCDDASPGVNPDAIEVWYDGIDGDCDGWSDEDADGDGYDRGDSAGEDCDDADPLVSPGALEACSDDIDNDCDGLLAGECALSGEIAASDARATILGEEGFYIGDVMASAGDVNGDGYDDVLLGRRYSDRAWIVRGPLSGALAISDADAHLTGDEDSLISFGEPIASGGDLDGDGLDEVLVADYCAGGDSGHCLGAVYVFGGEQTGDLNEGDAEAVLEGDFQKFATGETSGSMAGSSLAGGSDANGDGVVDLLVGAPYAADWEATDGATYWGEVYLLLGPVTTGGVVSEMAAATFAADPDPEFAYIGYEVAFAGDTDGDGIVEVAVTARGDSTGADGGGGVRFFPGDLNGLWHLSDTEAHIYGAQADHYIGTVVGLNDVNGDGLDDVAVMDDEWSGSLENQGAACVFLGPLGSSHPLSEAWAIIEGTMENGYAGSLASAGDVDGDGVGDVLFGTDNHRPGESDSDVGRGAAWWPRSSFRP